MSNIIVITGKSGTGKSHITDTFADLVPAELRAKEDYFEKNWNTSIKPNIHFFVLESVPQAHLVDVVKYLNVEYPMPTIVVHTYGKVEEEVHKEVKSVITLQSETRVGTETLSMIKCKVRLLISTYTRKAKREPFCRLSEKNILAGEIAEELKSLDRALDKL